MLSVHHLEENKKRQKHELLRCLLKLEVINHIWEGGPYSRVPRQVIILPV